MLERAIQCSQAATSPPQTHFSRQVGTISLDSRNPFSSVQDDRALAK
jgi:hypothetical protein